MVSCILMYFIKMKSWLLQNHVFQNHVYPCYCLPCYRLPCYCHHQIVMYQSFEISNLVNQINNFWLMVRIYLDPPRPGYHLMSQIDDHWLMGHIDLDSAQPRYFPCVKLGIYASGLQKSGLFMAARLKHVRENIMGVTDNVPCKSVCVLSPNTIKAKGICFPFAPQNGLCAPSQASLAWISP